MKKVFTILLLSIVALTASATRVAEVEEETPGAVADTSWFVGSGVPVQYNSPAEFTAATGRTLTYKEAPSLAALVASGALPPVDARLPRDPVVIAPAQEIGTYGGEFIIPGDAGWINDEYMRQWYLTISLSGDELLGNIVASYESNADATVWTLKLRDGLRWSDGEPFTTEDIEFWYDHDATDPNLNPDGVGSLKVDGVMGELTIVDDITFRFRFVSSFPIFPSKLMRWFPDSPEPKHYMQQFHPAFIGENEAQDLAEEAGYVTWMAYWQEYLMWSNFNSELPVVHTFQLQSKTDSLAVFERNPYYFKVDVDGNQLPYVDTIRTPLIGSGDPVMLKGLAGEIDVALHWDFGDVANYSVMKNGEASGGYRLAPAMSALQYFGTVYFNFAHEDLERRALFENIDFRRAVALAIDGQELNDVLFRGQYILSQSPASGDLYHAPAERYKGHDLEEANRLLDSLDLEWKPGDSFRTLPSGEPLELFLIVESVKQMDVQASEIYKVQLAKAGIDLLIRPYGEEIMGEKLNEGEYDILVIALDVPRGIPTNSIANMPHVVPANPQGSHVSTAWVKWLHSNGAEGLEPPQDMKRLYELYQEWPKTASVEGRKAIEHEIVDVFSANLWSISPVENPVDTPQVGYYYMNNRVGNVPSAALNSEFSYIFLETYYVAE